MKENAYLIIHGFNGKPDDIKYLDEYLQGKGLYSRTVLLDGHGSTKKALKNSSHISWLGSVKSVICELAREYRYVNLIGFSMGGLISICFAPLLEVRRIVLINTPIYFWNIKIILSNIMNGICSRNHEKLAYYKQSVFTVSMKSSVDFLRILAKA